VVAELTQTSKAWREFVQDLVEGFRLPPLRGVAGAFDHPDVAAPQRRRPAIYCRALSFIFSILASLATQIFSRDAPNVISARDALDCRISDNCLHRMNGISLACKAARD
jgi:hypothetical protein